MYNVNVWNIQTAGIWLIDQIYFEMVRCFILKCKSRKELPNFWQYDETCLNLKFATK